MDPAPATNFRRRTFIECVSLAAREPVYSAAIGWLFTEQSPLPLEQRVALLSSLSGEQMSDAISIDVVTEWNDVDVFLSVRRDGDPIHLAIENKIKATESERQLASYDRHLAALSGQVRKVFLTLTGDHPCSGVHWTAVSYAHFLVAVRAQPASSNCYVADLCDALDRLVAVADGARRGEVGVVASAFNDEDDPSNDAGEYIAEMRLNKVAQRIWMTELAKTPGVSPPWSLALGETHGQALMNIQAALHAPVGYLVGLQLQRRTLKAFCMPHPYPPSRATPAQHSDVEGILEIVRSKFALDRSAKASARRTRGFRSFSIVAMPPGRKLDDWASVLKPKFELLKAAFASAHAISADTTPIVTEDE